MKLKFFGVGNAFASKELYQSNAGLIEDNQVFLIDCGTDIRHAMQEQMDIHNGNVGAIITGIYISHLHADHCGGLEWPAFCTYFNPKSPKIELFSHSELITPLWENVLKGGMGSVKGKGEMILEDYFNVNKLTDLSKIQINKTTSIKTVRSIHFKANPNKESFGLFIKNNLKCYFTTDVENENYSKNKKYYDDADIIFHDCETTPYESGVHAHYNFLKLLPSDIKKKMWLYHYSDDYTNFNPIKDGFHGFVHKGQEFEI
jgi:ribonuclease BN (tRNA processing enzyme)